MSPGFYFQFVACLENVINNARPYNSNIESRHLLLPKSSKGEPGLEQKVIQHYITFSSEKAPTVVRKAKENEALQKQEKVGKSNH